MRNRSPYRFPLRSRAAMVDYIFGRSSRSDNWTNYVFAWSVKAYHADVLNPKGAHTPNPKHQAAWEAYCERADIFWRACEDASRQYTDAEYSTYPGDDQVDWQFGFIGRSCGWLVLSKWCDRDMRTLERWELDEWEFRSIRTLYRALVCMDHDFTPENASEEVEAHANFMRELFDDEQDEKQERADACFARRLEESRPDLYGAA